MLPVADTGFYKKKRDGGWGLGVGGRGLNYHCRIGEVPGTAQAPEAQRMRKPVEAISGNFSNEIYSIDLIDRL